MTKHTNKTADNTSYDWRDCMIDFLTQHWKSREDNHTNSPPLPQHVSILTVSFSLWFILHTNHVHRPLQVYSTASHTGSTSQTRSLVHGRRGWRAPGFRARRQVTTSRLRIASTSSWVRCDMFIHINCLYTPINIIFLLYLVLHK